MPRRKSLSDRLSLSGITTVSCHLASRTWELALSVETVPPYRLQLTGAKGPQPTYWAMENYDGWHERRYRDDELRGAAIEEFRKDPRTKPHTRRQDVLLVEALSRFAQMALDFSTPAPRDLALALYPRLRFNAYQLLNDDSSGRLAQLRGACPGAFVLLAALRRRAKHAEAAARFHREIIAGRKLNQALREVLGSIAPVDGKALETWLAVIRRAPITVSATGVAEPAPRGVAVDDIPVHPASRRCWFEVVTCLSLALSSRPAHPAHPSIAEFVSRHASLVRRWLVLRHRESSEFIAFVEKSGRVVGRGVDPVAVLRDFADYSGPTEPFPAAPVAPLDAGDAKLEHIADRRSLVRHARAFHNCARRYSSCLVRGDTALYVGNLTGRRVMIELTRDKDAWCCRQVRGFADRLPTQKELAMVRQWMRTAQRSEVSKGSQPGSPLPSPLARLTDVCAVPAATESTNVIQCSP